MLQNSVPAPNESVPPRARPHVLAAVPFRGLRERGGRRAVAPGTASGRVAALSVRSGGTPEQL